MGELHHDEGIELECEKGRVLEVSIGQTVLDILKPLSCYHFPNVPRLHLTSQFNRQRTISRLGPSNYLTSGYVGLLVLTRP